MAGRKTKLPGKLSKIDGGSQMRRGIEVLINDNKHGLTSFFRIDSLFSSLLLPPAARGLFLKKPPPGPPQKLLIKINYKEKKNAYKFSKCLILDLKSIGSKRRRRPIYGFNGPLDQKTIGGNGNGQRFLRYKKIRGIPIIPGFKKRSVNK
jgi:hypothetical protein